MDIPFSKHTLENGLDVLVHEDHARAHRGRQRLVSRRVEERSPGRTGFAHLFEHLMFEGSQHYDRGYFHPLQDAGASLNGSTNADRTNYWEVVPTNALDLALWMESDRMGYLLPALTDAKFENQRDVVLNERRQNYENRPYGMAGMAHRRRAVPARPSVPLADDRRHRRPARGAASTKSGRSSSATITGATPRWRWPATSTRDAALALAEQYFAEIPARRDRRA